MMRGKYFEYGLIGSCRGGDIPVLKKLKNGEKSQPEKDLDELIIFAKMVLDNMGLSLDGAETQLEIIAGDLSGHLDLVAQDIQNPARKAIYDVKYTETQLDDRWNGWADFERKIDEQIQASHYIRLYHEKHGVYVPYYFLVFGKAFWCKIIKVVVTGETMVFHNQRIEFTKQKLIDWAKNGWPAKPEFNKCNNCFFNDRCKFVAAVPEIETFQI